MPSKVRVRKLGLSVAAVAAVLWVTAVVWAGRPVLNWPDRRPIGTLFVASNHHASPKNPRGWFNDPALDVTGPGGHQRFCTALLAFADHSVAILRSTGAQGMIVWDIEGEQYPHKTTYIGDPRLLSRLAPETDGCVDEFFARFRRSGLRTGVTIRPQELEFPPTGVPRQKTGWNYATVIAEKIDYCRRRWGATLFYLDSNGGALWPLEGLHLRHIAASRPDILVLPEYQHPLYHAFSAPYDDARRGDRETPLVLRYLYPYAFKALNVSDIAARAPAVVETAYRNGDILLFRAWFCDADCETIRRLRTKQQEY